MNSCEGIVKDLAGYMKKVCGKHSIHMVDLYIKIQPVLPVDANGQIQANRAFMEYSESGKFV